MQNLNELKDRIWNIQNGKRDIAKDFSGREIRWVDYNNKNSNFGWVLIRWDEFNYVIANVKTEIEIPKSVIGVEGVEFIANSHVFIFVKNDYQEWDAYMLDEKLDKYETYSSMLINLYHFPIEYFEKYEQFLEDYFKRSSFLKEIFNYSNMRLYAKGISQINFYSRIFFKSKSNKENMEILFHVLEFRERLSEFIKRFNSLNKIRPVSFSLVLMSHWNHLKFVYAGTNYELLEMFPIPTKLPQALIINDDFNSLLKFYEFELWKRVKPFALNEEKNIAYYICDINVNTSF